MISRGPVQFLMDEPPRTRMSAKARQYWQRSLGGTGVWELMHNWNANGDADVNGYWKSTPNRMATNYIKRNKELLQETGKQMSAQRASEQNRQQSGRYNNRPDSSSSKHSQQGNRRHRQSSSLNRLPTTLNGAPPGEHYREEPARLYHQTNNYSNPNINHDSYNNNPDISRANYNNPNVSRQNYSNLNVFRDTYSNQDVYRNNDSLLGQTKLPSANQRAGQISIQNTRQISAPRRRHNSVQNFAPTYSQSPNQQQHLQYESQNQTYSTETRGVQFEAPRQRHNSVQEGGGHDGYHHSRSREYRAENDHRPGSQLSSDGRRRWSLDDNPNHHPTILAPKQPKTNPQNESPSEVMRHSNSTHSKKHHKSRNRDRNRSKSSSSSSSSSSPSSSEKHFNKQGHKTFQQVTLNGKVVQNSEQNNESTTNHDSLPLYDHQHNDNETTSLTTVTHQQRPATVHHTRWQSSTPNLVENNGNESYQRDYNGTNQAAGYAGSGGHRETNTRFSRTLSLDDLNRVSRHEADGYVLIPQEQKEHMYFQLKDEQTKLLRRLNSLPLIMDTPRLRRHKTDLLQQIYRIDRAVTTFGRPEVYIRQ